MNNKYIYKIFETTQIGRSQSGESGVIYFSTYKKALDEFNRRVENFENIYGQRGTYTHEVKDKSYTIQTLDKKITYNLYLHRYDLY